MDEVEDNSLEDARQLVRDYEVRTKRSFYLSILIIFLGFLMIGIFAYSQSKAEEVRAIGASLAQQAEQSELTKLLNNIVDKKIDLLRHEIKLRYNISGVLGGVMIGAGITGLFGYKRRCRQARAIRSVINRVSKDS